MEAEEFLTWLAVERGRAPSTIEAYRRDLRRYAAWLDGRPLASVGESDVTTFVHFLGAEGRAPASVARSTVAVRSLHRYLAVEEVVPVDAGADVEAPRVPAGLPKALGEDEVTRLIDGVTGDDPVARRDRAILEVLYGTGIRIAELVGLSLADVDLDGRLLRAFGKGRKRTDRAARPHGAARARGVVRPRRAARRSLPPGGRGAATPRPCS